MIIAGCDRLMNSHNIKNWYPQRSKLQFYINTTIFCFVVKCKLTLNSYKIKMTVTDYYLPLSGTRFSFFFTPVRTTTS